MKKDFTVIHMPQWVKDAIRRKKQRERYFIKKYGSLERMYEKDGRENDKLDKDEFDDEIKMMEERRK